MRTPSHWKNDNLLSSVLLPIGWAYGLATALRLKLVKPRKVNIPVICIGNLTAGGTGKTPVAIAIAKLLQEQNHHPFFITRGYGGTLQDVLVDTLQHNAQMVGDEPLLLASQAPVVVNRLRFEAAQKAQSAEADCIIMDDGFQNPQLHKDLSLLVIDGGYGLGNQHCIPAGPLREFKKAGLKRANGIIIIGDDKFNIAQKVGKIPVFKGKITPIKPQTSNNRAIAFAGIGRPQKFYQSLTELGFELLQTFDFPDHHYYNESELQELIALAQEKEAVLYTTSKDFVKITPHLQKHFQVLEITIEWEDKNQLLSFLSRGLSS